MWCYPMCYRSFEGAEQRKLFLSRLPLLRRARKLQLDDLHREPTDGGWIVQFEVEG